MKCFFLYVSCLRHECIIEIFNYVFGCNSYIRLYYIYIYECIMLARNIKIYIQRITLGVFCLGPAYFYFFNNNETIEYKSSTALTNFGISNKEILLSSKTSFTFARQDSKRCQISGGMFIFDHPFNSYVSIYKNITGQMRFLSYWKQKLI
jgi:hypothetical protein